MVFKIFATAVDTRRTRLTLREIDNLAVECFAVSGTIAPTIEETAVLGLFASKETAIEWVRLVYLHPPKRSRKKKS